MLKNNSLAFIFFMLTANMAIAQNPKGETSTIILNGGKNTLTEFKKLDTIDAIDPVTDETTRGFQWSRTVTKFNSNPVYQYAQVKKPARKFLRGDVQKVLNRKLRQDIQEAWNFFGHIELIIDEKGNIVFNDINLYTTDLSGTTSKPVDKEKSDRIRKNISQKLSAMHFKPARKDGKPVAYHAMFY